MRVSQLKNPLLIHPNHTLLTMIINDNDLPQQQPRQIPKRMIQYSANWHNNCIKRAPNRNQRINLIKMTERTVIGIHVNQMKNDLTMEVEMIDLKTDKAKRRMIKIINGDPGIEEGRMVTIAVDLIDQDHMIDIMMMMIEYLTKIIQIILTGKKRHRMITKKKLKEKMVIMMMADIEEVMEVIRITIAQLKKRKKIKQMMKVNLQGTMMTSLRKSSLKEESNKAMISGKIMMIRMRQILQIDQTKRNHLDRNPKENLPWRIGMEKTNQIKTRCKEVVDAVMITMAIIVTILEITMIEIATGDTQIGLILIIEIHMDPVITRIIWITVVKGTIECHQEEDGAE